MFEPIPEDTRKQIERRASRVEVPGEISLRAVGRNPYRVRVLDLSTDGCRVDLVESRPNVGEHVLVKFEGIETMDAEICWIEDIPPASGSRANSTRRSWISCSSGSARARRSGVEGARR